MLKDGGIGARFIGAFDNTPDNKLDNVEITILVFSLLQKHLTLFKVGRTEFKFHPFPFKYLTLELSLLAKSCTTQLITNRLCHM